MLILLANIFAFILTDYKFSRLFGKISRHKKHFFSADIAQLAEQLFCKQQVVGSSPSIGSITKVNQQAGLPKRSTGADCKSADVCLREFESLTRHHKIPFVLNANKIYKLKMFYATLAQG